MRWAGHVVRMGEERGCIWSWWGNRRKEPTGETRTRWVDNIRMDLQEVGRGHMDWIGRAQDRDRWRTLVSAVMNLRVPWKVGNFLTSCKPVSFSTRTLHSGVSKYNSRYMFRPKCSAIIRVIFEQVLCTIDNAFNLRDLVLQELVTIIVVCYIKLKIKTQRWYFIR